VINTVEANSRILNVTHEPIPELNWPTMTMDFPVAQGVKLEGLKPDSRMRFRISEGEDGRYQIDAADELSPPTPLPQGSRGEQP
jgi:Cu/Ag efflux protein CusF